MTLLADTDLDLAALSDPGRELVLSAAVQERFRPSQLMDDWLKRQGPDVPDSALQEALDVTLSLGALSGGGAERPEGTELPLALRRQVLATAGLSEARAALAREGPRTRAERCFADLVAGQVPDTSAMGRGDLLALATAAAWAEGLKDAAQIDPSEVTRRLANQEFVERVGGADLSLFVGRETLLNALKRLWMLRDRPIVLVEGPGGIGKSIAVARFFQILLADNDADMRPDAILHLDFDLPNMQRATALDMAIEIVRQLTLRWSPVPGSGLRGLLRALGGGGFGGQDSTRISKAQTSEVRDYRSQSSASEILAEALALFGARRKHPLRLILFADSFERAEVLDEVAATNVSRIVDALRITGVDLMVIYAARAYVQPGRLAESARPAHQNVTRFTQGEAVDYLTGKAHQRGIDLSRNLAARANRVIKGWPLGLRIAVSLLGNTPETFDPADWLVQIEHGGRSVQATLYERLLHRIEDENLRRLAKPGLLVRRITTEVIEHVLAEPCGLPADADAAELMAKAEREGQLFWRDSVDPGALWHRQDLREIMLPVLRLDVPKDVARAIHDAAVAYYADKTSDIARAEELYHRLCRGDSRDAVEMRWRDSAGQRLVGSLGELPAPAAAMVRLLLGGGRSDTASGLNELRAVAQNRLSEGVTDLADLFAQAGLPESLDTPLGDIYALSLTRQGRYVDLVRGAERIATARNVPAQVKARIAISAASVVEGLYDLDRSLKFWRLAHRNSDDLSALEQLTVRIALARLPRRIGSGTQGRHTHVLAACDLLVAEARTGTSQRVTRLEAVAELSEVLQPVRSWQERAEPDAQGLLLNLFRDLRPMFPSAMENRQRLEELARTLDVHPDEVHRPSDIDSLMYKCFNNPDPSLHARALSALRSEVDAAFSAAIGLTPEGQAESTAPRNLTY